MTGDAPSNACGASHEAQISAQWLAAARLAPGGALAAGVQAAAGLRLAADLAESRLLIVDDEPFIRDVLARWLAAEGYECRVSANAAEAWQLLERERFALVLSDVNMPGLSGIEFLSLVKERFGDEVAIIMVTGVDDRQTGIQALELGAYGYVIKPFEHNEVVIHVVNALERRRLVRASKEYERELEERVRQQTREIRHSREEIALRLIAAQECRHDETGAHVRRMGLYAEALGRKLGHPASYNDMLRLAAPMHDVGKIGIPDAILTKPTQLTPEEFATMKTHTTIGASILDGASLPLLSVARDIALHHHERWGGGGYPHGLGGGQIPEAARIVAVLDVYDALVHNRVYRPALPELQALALMREGRGEHFDPRVFDAFLETLPELRDIRRRV